MNSSSPDVRQRLRTTLQAVGLLLVLLLVFFSTPLSSLGHSYYSSADLSLGAELTRSLDGQRPKNQVLSDPAVQMQPWLMFNRDAFAAGEIPLWNDWNSNGAPHLANYQSSVFSPFSLPFYLLDFRWALLVAAGAKLFCLGFFTYLFFRALELRQLAALTGAVAFAFSGLNVLLLAYPHSAVAITLPAGLFCTEKAIRAREAWLGWRAPSSSSRRGTRWVLALCLVLAGGLLSGHPEPFCFALLLISAYLVFRLASTRAEHRSDPRANASLLSLLVAITFAGVLAAGLACVQTLPFLEYLSHSMTLDSRGMAKLEIGNWPLSVFPNVLGNPSTGILMLFELPFANFEEVNTAYLGGLIVWLTVLGACVTRSRRFLFFFAWIVVGTIYGYDLLGIAEYAGHNLVTSAAPMRRSQVVGVFGMCACAALCVDRLLVDGARTRKRTVLFAALSAMAVLLLAWLGAERLFASSIAMGPTLSTPEELEEAAARHYVSIACSVGVGVLALLIRLRARGAALKLACGSLFLAALFFESGFLLKDYNPTIEDAAFFPRTPGIQAIQEHVGNKHLMVLGESCLPPDSNLAYGLRLAASYDALWILKYDNLYSALFNSLDNWRTATGVTENGLQICGVEYLLTDSPWVPVDTETNGGDTRGWVETDWIMLYPNRIVSQTFVAEQDRLQAIELRALRTSKVEPRDLRVVLEDLSTGQKVAASYIELSHRAPIPGDPRAVSDIVLTPVVFHFEPIEDSAGKPYRISIRAAKGPADDEVAIGVLQAAALPPATPGETYEIDELPADGRLWFNRSYNMDAFETVQQLTPYTLWRYKNSLTRFYCVDGAEVALTDEEALSRVTAPEFDPSRVVVLSAPVQEPVIQTSAAGPAQPATVHTDTHKYTRLSIERSRPGYLLIARAHFPGWRASVNGVERELLRANVGLSAVQVEAGMNEIELRYDPQSFRLGLWLSSLCALALAIWTAGAARAARAARAA